MNRTPRLRACCACRIKFQPARPLQKACSPLCALVDIEKRKARDQANERRRDRARLQALKTRSQLIREAQTAVNAYIRARDADRPCVSCGRWHDGQWHAGHYLSTGARPDLRFDESNIHRQCQPCNTHLSGNLIPYRQELIRRIGQAEVDRMEGPPTNEKLSREQIVQIAREYREKTRQLQSLA